MFSTKRAASPGRKPFVVRSSAPTLAAGAHHSAVPFPHRSGAVLGKSNREQVSGKLPSLGTGKTAALVPSRYMFVFGNAYGDVSDGFDRLVIVVPAFVGSAVVQPQPNASRCAAYASAPSDIDARPVSVSLQRQASCGELNRNNPPGSSELATLVRSFCWSPSLSRKISPIEITPTNVLPKKELF